MYGRRKTKPQALAIEIGKLHRSGTSAERLRRVDPEEENRGTEATEKQQEKTRARRSRRTRRKTTKKLLFFVPFVSFVPSW